MSDPQTGSTKTADALDHWRELRDSYVDIWAKASGEAVNSEAYAQASGAMLEAVLSGSSPFRDAQKKAMVGALEQCNMPSRDDYVRLAERLSNMELLLDDMDARLRQVLGLVSKAAPQPAAASHPAPAQKSAPAPQPQLFAAPNPSSKPALEPASAAKPSPAPQLFAAPNPAAAPQPSPKSAAASKAAPRKAPAKITKKGSK
jgi:hypothetical protein